MPKNRHFPVVFPPAEKFLALEIGAGRIFEVSRRNVTIDNTRIANTHHTTSKIPPGAGAGPGSGGPDPENVRKSQKIAFPYDN